MHSEEHNLMVGLLERYPQLIHPMLSLLGLPPLDQDELPYSHAAHMPMPAAAHEPDNVIAIYKETEAPRRLVSRGVVVETQRSRDGAKKLTWPLYVAKTRVALWCVNVALIVITFSRRLARWAHMRIRFGDGEMVVNNILSPENVPVIRSREEARKDPYLTLLSAAIHLPAYRDAQSSARDAIARALGAESVAILEAAAAALAKLRLPGARYQFKIYMTLLSQRVREEYRVKIHQSAEQFYQEIEDSDIQKVRAEAQAEFEAKLSRLKDETALFKATLESELARMREENMEKAKTADAIAKVKAELEAEVQSLMAELEASDRAYVLTVLEGRFGPLSPETVSELEAASRDGLKAVRTLAREAGSLDEALAPLRTRAS